MSKPINEAPVKNKRCPNKPNRTIYIGKAYDYWQDYLFKLSKNSINFNFIFITSMVNVLKFRISAEICVM